MIGTAENLAESFNISPEEAIALALESLKFGTEWSHIELDLTAEEDRQRFSQLQLVTLDNDCTPFAFFLTRLCKRILQRRLRMGSNIK